MKEIDNYKKALSKLINKFELKQDLELTNSIGHVFTFNEDYFFSLDEVILDLEKDVEPGKIITYYNEMVERSLAELPIMNYQSYIIGLTFEDLERIKKEDLKKLQDRIKEIENEFMNTNINN